MSPEIKEKVDGELSSPSNGKGSDPVGEGADIFSRAIASIVERDRARQVATASPPVQQYLGPNAYPSFVHQRTGRCDAKGVPLLESVEAQELFI